MDERENAINKDIDDAHEAKVNAKKLEEENIKNCLYFFLSFS